MRRKGFTLIELLMVISIIGLLSSVVFIRYKDAVEKAKYQKTQRELEQIYTSIITAEFVNDDVIMHITKSGCSACACWRYGVKSSSCIRNWENVARSINMPTQIRDGWGNPFLLDENELEFASNPCRQDWLCSAGPNQVVGGDDICLSIPFYSEQCKNK